MGRTHIRALAGSAHVQVVAVAEPNKDAWDSLNALGLSVYESVAEMLSAGGIDGVLIAAPSDQHLELVRQIASAGLPILCEKPCGVNSTQTHEAGVAAHEHGVRLHIGYWRRFVPELQALRTRILQKELGTIFHIVCAQWDESPPPDQFREHSGGIFVDMGVHEIDQLRWLSGHEVAESAVSAVPWRDAPAGVQDCDSAQALLTLSDGSSAAISLGRLHPNGDVVTAEVFGSEGYERIAVLGPCDGEAPQLDALRRQAEAFAGAAADVGIDEGATVEDAQIALAVAEQLSAKLNHTAP